MVKMKVILVLTYINTTKGGEAKRQKSEAEEGQMGAAKSKTQGN